MNISKLDMVTLTLMGFFIAMYATVCVHVMSVTNVGQSVIAFLGN